nr:MAG TPA: Ribonucleotide reductase inhibitor [Caudoviricetes sp.]
MKVRKRVKDGYNEVIKNIHNGYWVKNISYFCTSFFER